MEDKQYVYICDGSVEGLLSCIHESYYSRNDVFDVIPQGNYQKNFVHTYQEIETDYAKAQKVAYAIKTKISKMTFEKTVDAWLSEMPLCGHHILEYIKMGFKIGNDVNSLLTQENVSFINKMSHKVSFETHRFLGILRFSRMEDGTYLSTIAPDHNILPLMAEHFAARLATERLIIFDEKRKTAILSDKGDWLIANDISIENIGYSEDEFVFRDMWHRYFETIAIKERTNKKLQRSFIPVRYWKNVVELKDELK